MANFEIQECEALDAVIKVVGVGGCGGNAVEHMVTGGVSGVEFIAMNTDSQALKRSKASKLLQLGAALTKGLGAGANPEIGRQAALADRERIAEMMAGADMLFITAGMGGGTGTGAAPVVAQIAREMGILTVAVVTKPFSFEGRRMKAAQEGIEQLSEYVDSLIIIPNEKLLSVLGDDVGMLEAYQAANDVLQGAVAGIAEVINCPGLVNVDFADVRTVMSEMGVAMMGSAAAAGIDRANVAAQQAIASPLLEDVNLNGARGVLVNITASQNMKLKEVHDVMNTIRSFTAEDATVIFGSVVDEAMGDSLRVTIVATGLGGPVVKRAQPQPLKVVRTGTDNVALDVDYETLDQPAVIRRGRNTMVEAMRDNGMDLLDIPAFLRKQAD
ncbi:MAG: cell division protein FtsZ [Betaproteobacteria bacterium]|nr:cell division protein FtsZ [Betaproteobacteria bacterium]MDE1980966.1 cell division protein FtsZ [Betaproteobacteria bacterium]MDE2131523.1 cell division protein FtsZ [Betaproteobacteria bacterium]MDE2211476.1 cell division protein FtsZ [Betaproteobacteria bacterium]MDE2354552.1 cell division protein FtsZ [Betaproteobacteria bacterium]